MSMVNLLICYESANLQIYNKYTNPEYVNLLTTMSMPIYDNNAYPLIYNDCAYMLVSIDNVNVPFSIHLPYFCDLT